MKQLLHQTSDVLSRVVDTVLPPRCPVTGRIVDEQGMVSSEAWAELEFIVDPFCQHCGIPFDFEMAGECICTDCLNTPPAFDAARCALKYNDTSRELILGFKHGDKTHFSPSFVPWLCRAGRSLIEKSDYIIPVPLHPKRLLSRRYNQAALMAQSLAKETGVPHWPDGMRRTRATVCQGHLRGDQRTQNVAHAFEISPPYRDKIKNKSVLLIDDVYTTGATVNECARILKQGGVNAVYVLTLARVLPDQSDADL